MITAHVNSCGYGRTVAFPVTFMVGKDANKGRVGTIGEEYSWLDGYDYTPKFEVIWDGLTMVSFWVLVVDSPAEGLGVILNDSLDNAAVNALFIDAFAAIRLIDREAIMNHARKLGAAMMPTPEDEHPVDMTSSYDIG